MSTTSDTLVFKESNQSSCPALRNKDDKLTIQCFGNINSTHISVRKLSIRKVMENKTTKATGDNITYEFGSLKCKDAGAYVCDTFSNGKNHSKRIDLLVQCCKLL